ncbi:MAG: 4-hydroxy-tetrahydrodipicolinate synthase [Proteobacteria bacterium]|nr:4-hydroxy-tetrahydrodipicolinate synthase [Pseudomonadota bacterium]
MVDLSGIWIPLITPLRGDAVDAAALPRLVRHLAAQGVAGFVVCGSTGEAAMLDADEQAQVLALTLQASGGKPVWMGLAGVRPAAVAARARQCAQAQPGVAGFLLAAPAYVKPSQAGIADFFTQVADASPRPLIVYDVPARSGVRIEPATLLALAAHPRIVAVKDCSGDRAAAQALLDDGRLALLAGNDDELFDQLARGAVGGISASAHVATAAFVELQRLLATDQLAAARAVWQRLAPLTRALFAEPNPAPVKAVLAQQGWISDELRAPLRPASAPARAAALAALA